MRKSLRTRLIGAFIGLGVIPLLLVSAVLVVYSFSVQQAQALDLQEQTARQVASDVTAFIHERENELRSLVEVRALHQLSETEQADQLAALLAYQDVYKEFILVDGTGQEPGVT